jgi:hypothetical protein
LAVLYLVVSTLKRGAFIREGILLLVLLFVARALLFFPIRWFARGRLNRMAKEQPSE